MTISASNTKKKQPISRKEKSDDSGLSKNNSKSVRFRLRIQEEREANDELKEFAKDEDGSRTS